jgi:hypothetical protein
MADVQANSRPHASRKMNIPIADSRNCGTSSIEQEVAGAGGIERSGEHSLRANFRTVEKSIVGRAGHLDSQTLRTFASGAWDASRRRR